MRHSLFFVRTVTPASEQHQATPRNFSFLVLHHYKWNPLLQSIGPLELILSYPEVLKSSVTLILYSFSHIKHHKKMFRTTPLFMILLLEYLGKQDCKTWGCMCITEREIMNS